MSDRIIFENDIAILRFHDEGIVHHEFKQRAIGQPFRDILQRGLTQLQASRATKWLSDDRKHTILDEADEAWAKGEWFPKAAAAGWKYWAVVNPTKAVGQMQTARHAKFFEVGGIKVAAFSTPEEALAWLRHMDAPMKKVG